MKSVMGHQFSKAPQAEIQRSTFDRSCGHKTTFNAGYLVPIYIDEALPGDSFDLSLTAFARLATPIFPIMDNLYMDTQFFAVPIRLLWNNFPKFMGEQTDPGDSTDYLIPEIASPVAGYPNESIHDYFGIPTKVTAVFNHSALWHRAYNLIYNEWYRDQNLQDSVVINRDDGPDLETDYTLLRRGKRHDYFTSCLPWPQKGPAVTIPLGTTAPLVADILTDGSVPTITGGGQTNADMQNVTGAAGITTNPTATGSTDAVWGDNTGLQLDPAGYADLSSATAATINQLRLAFQIQKLYERDARGGSRYTEIIRAHFGVVSSDARLQRPEYLGGGSQPINVSAVQQTSSTDVTSPQGNLAAFATVGFSGHGFRKRFDEHCVIIGLVSIRADLTYQQGLPRMLSRSTRWDYYWPALAHIGEQAVLNKEIYTDGSAADEEVFGYQERFAEYRYKNSQISGILRSNDAQSLDSWHLSQDFGVLPTLNAAFIEDNPPVDRVIAVPSEPHCIFDSYIKLTCTRPMPLYSVPGLIDHF